MTLKLTPRQAKIIFGGFVALVVVGLLVAFISDQQASSDTDIPTVEYRNDETGLERFEDGRVNIDIETATDGQAPHGTATITVTSVNATMSREIIMLGAWKGHEFRHMVQRDDINRSSDNNDVLMEATTQFDPQDDRIEGYIVPRFNYTKPNGTGFDFTVYVDQQFMDAVEDPQVRWGFTLEHNKSFEPKEVIDGVYRETVSMRNVERIKGDILAKPHAFVGEWPDREENPYGEGDLKVENETYFVTY